MTTNKPTRAQREVLEALRDDAELYHLPTYGLRLTRNGVTFKKLRFETFHKLREAGLIEFSSRDVVTTYYTISAAGREAIAKGGE